MTETVNSKAAHVREHADAIVQALEDVRRQLEQLTVMAQHASLIAEGIEAETDES